MEVLMAADVIIGIDGGGTHTRAMATTIDGHVLTYIETGPTSPKHTEQGYGNVQRAIREVVCRAERRFSDVVYVVAGLSGLDRHDDYTWAEHYTAVPELTCPRLHVNDAVVAHTGAFGGHAGILAIAGTGSNVFAITDTGQQLRNGDFIHYAFAAAVHIASDSILHILAGDHEAEDQAFVQQVLTYWQVTDVDRLRAKGTLGFVSDPLERLAVTSAMAPLVTEAAQNGSPLARAVCDRAANTLVLGIRLIGSCFTAPMVSVALTGSVARSTYIRRAINRALSKWSNPSYHIIEPTFAPVVGAVLLGIQGYTGNVEEAVVQTLQHYPQTSINISA